jgi:transcription elongation factor SPT5
MRLFNASEVAAAGGNVSQRRFRFSGNLASACRNWALADETFDVFENGFYLLGFLYKEVNILTMLQVGDPNPTLDELQRFVVDAEWRDNVQCSKAKRSAAYEHQGSLMAQIEQLARGVRSNRNGLEHRFLAAFAKDDKVEAVDGEMRGTVFVVDRVDSAGIVHCRVTDEMQNHDVVIPMEPHRLLKSIPVGSHVKVQDGKYAGQTGVVLERGELDGDHVGVILTDCGGREITARLLHVQESREVSRGLDALEGYELYDLVLLPLGAVGVITHVASDDIEVLTLRGELKIVRPAEIARKLNNESSRNVSLDSKDEHVRETDHVILDNGKDAGTLATVIRAHRASLWLLKTASGAAFAPCGGLFVRKARQVHVAGDKASGDCLADTYMGLGKQRVVNEDQFNDKSNGALRTRGALGTIDPLIGRTVRICKGNYKGLAGIVTTATSTHVTVELHTRCRSVTLPRGCVKRVAGTAGGEPELAIQRRIAEQEAYNADLLSTPFLTQATPLLSGATPQYGAATPHHATPSRSTATPIWGTTTPAFGPQTPHYALHTPGHEIATPGHTGLEDVWRPRVVGKSPIQSAISPGYRGMPIHSNNKSPAYGESSVCTPTHQPSQLLPSNSRSNAWCVAGAEAKLEDGQVCKITSVLKNLVTVALKGSKAITRSLPISALIRVKPETGNRVRVVDGGQVYDAELLSIEDSDGIIKLTNGEYKIIDFLAIANIAKF